MARESGLLRRAAGSSVPAVAQNRNTKYCRSKKLLNRILRLITRYGRSRTETESHRPGSPFRDRVAVTRQTAPRVCLSTISIVEIEPVI